LFGDNYRSPLATIIIPRRGVAGTGWPAAGDCNLYRYVNNHPTDFSDPSGMQLVVDNVAKPTPLVANINALPMTLNYPNTGWFGPDNYTLYNIVMKVPLGARKTNSTTTILIFEKTKARPVTKVETATWTTNWGLWSTEYFRVEIDVSIKLSLYKVTFREYCENGNSKWSLPFNTYDNVPETIEKLPSVDWPLAKCHEDFPAGTELSKEALNDMAKEAIKAALEALAK
jgi:hypothetical protein